MRRRAKDILYTVCALVRASLSRFVNWHVLRPYLDSAIANDHRGLSRWPSGRHRSSRICDPSKRRYARHCLLPVQVMKPNPAVNWTASTLRVPAASYFERWAP